ncbi:uncharacterized protein LOC122054140 isoform X2 [Zingiber officinale]|nr:uncharacterized protein LOC122054140 isoform X2 [Zingiber officinale]
MLKRQRAFSEELRQVKSSQPSHLSPSVSQAAASLGGADTGLVQRSQSLSKDSEALEGAPVKPPRNWEQSPQPPTSPRWSTWKDSSLGEQPSAWSAKSPQPSASPRGSSWPYSSWGEQPSAWSAKSPQPSTSPRSSSWTDWSSDFDPFQPSSWSAKIPQSSLMLPPAARPSLPTPEERQALRSLSITDLLEKNLVFQTELKERISRLSADYAASQAQETKLRSLAEYWEKKAKAIEAEKAQETKLRSLADFWENKAKTMEAEKLHLSERMAKVLIELDESKAELEAVRSKMEGMSSMLNGASFMLNGAKVKLEGARTELQSAAKEKASLGVKES